MAARYSSTKSKSDVHFSRREPEDEGFYEEKVEPKSVRRRRGLKKQREARASHIDALLQSLEAIDAVKDEQELEAPFSTFEAPASAQPLVEEAEAFFPLSSSNNREVFLATMRSFVDEDEEEDEVASARAKFEDFCEQARRQTKAFKLLETEDMAEKIADARRQAASLLRSVEEPGNPGAIRVAAVRDNLKQATINRKECSTYQAKFKERLSSLVEASRGGGAAEDRVELNRLLTDLHEHEADVKSRSRAGFAKLRCEPLALALDPAAAKQHRETTRRRAMDRRDSARERRQAQQRAKEQEHLKPDDDDDDDDPDDDNNPTTITPGKNGILEEADAGDASPRPLLQSASMPLIATSAPSGQRSPRRESLPPGTLVEPNLASSASSSLLPAT